MNKKTIITFSSIALIVAGLGTYLLLKRRKIKNLSNDDKLKLVHKSLQEDKDFGVTPIWKMKNTEENFFLVNKYIKDFIKIPFDGEYKPTEEGRATEYYKPLLSIAGLKNYPDILTINVDDLDSSMQPYQLSINGFIDLGLNTTITLIFYKDYVSSYEEANRNDGLFRKKFSGRNSAVALKKVFEYFCSGKVYKEFEKYNIQLTKTDEIYKFCQKLK